MITYYIALLLTIYVGVWLYRTYHRTSIKNYFKKQVRDLDYQIADLEFKRFKTQEAREEIRKDYDVSKSQLEALISEMATEDAKKGNDPTKLNKDERARLDDRKVIMERNIKRKEVGRDEGDPGAYVMNLKDFDQAIAVSNSQLDQLRSLKNLLKDYIDKEL